MQQSIEMPEPREKYKFGSMEVGDWFAVAPDKLRSARCAASAYGKRHGLEFVSRTDKDGVTRIWRTK